MTHQTNPKPLFSAPSISSIIEAMLTEDNHQFTESTTDGVVTYQVHGKYYDNGIVYIHASDSQKSKYYVGSTVNAKRANSTNEGGRGKRYDEQSMSVQYIIEGLPASYHANDLELSERKLWCMLNREGYQLLNNKPRSIQCSWRRMPWELAVRNDLPVQYNVLAMWRVMPYIWDIYRTQRFSLGRKDRDNIPDASAISPAQRLRISTLAADCHNNGNTLAHVITFILAELGIEYRPTNHQISSGMERKFQMHTDDESWMTDVFLPAHAAFDWDKAMSAVNVNHDAGKWTDLRQFLSASMLKLNVAQNEQRVGEYPEVKDEERVFIRKAPDGRKSRKNVFGERVQA